MHQHRPRHNGSSIVSSTVPSGSVQFLSNPNVLSDTSPGRELTYLSQHNRFMLRNLIYIVKANTNSEAIERLTEVEPNNIDSHVIDTAPVQCLGVFIASAQMPDFDISVESNSASNTL